METLKAHHVTHIPSVFSSITSPPLTPTKFEIHDCNITEDKTPWIELIFNGNQVT